MALNFGGMGFSFGATDSGAVEISNRVSSSINGVWTGLQKVGPAAMGASRMLKGGLSKIAGVGKSAMGGLSMALASAVDSATNPTLEGAYASMFADFNKGFSAMTAGMNITSKEAKKMERTIGSAAFALNEDMDGAAKSWAGFRKQGIDLVKVMGAKGMKGAIKDLIKVTSVYGIEGEQLSLVMGGMIKGFGFTEERVKGLFDEVVSIGKLFDMGTESVRDMPAIFETLNAELADFGRNAKPEDIEHLTKSIVALGGGFHEALGMGAESGLELARTVFTTLMGERKNIQNMRRGMGEEIGVFAQQLAESGGSVEGMFSMIQADPLKFMESLREMGKAAEARGGQTGMAFQRLNKQITDALGSNVSFAMQGSWDKVRGTLAKIPATLEKSEGAFGNIARASHKTAITAQEGWDRMMNSMRNKLLAISGPARRRWVKDMTGGFNQTIGVIQKMAKMKGPEGKLHPVAELTQKLLLVKDVGLSALIPALGKFSTLFGGLATSMFPAMTALGSMGVSFRSLGKMALAGGGLYGLFYLLKNGPEEAIKSLKNMWTTFKTFISKLSPTVGVFLTMVENTVVSIKKYGLGATIKYMFSSINWDSIKEKVKSGISTVFGWIKKIPFTEIFGGLKNIGVGIINMVKGIDFRAIFGALSRAFAAIPWGKIISGAFSLVKGLATGVIGLIKSFIMGTDWKALAITVGKALISALKGVADLAGGILGALFSPSDTDTETTAAGMMGALSGIVSAIVSLAQGLIKGAAGELWGYFFDSDSMGESLGKIVKIVGVAFVAILVLSKKFRTKMATGMKSTFAKIRNEFKTTTSKGKAMIGTLKAGFKGLKAGLKGGLRMFGGIGMIMGLIEAINQVKVRMKNIDTIAKNDLIPDFQKVQLEGEQAFMGIGETIDSVFLGLPSQIGNALGISADDFSNFYHTLVAGAEEAITRFMGVWGAAFQFLGNSWENMKQTADYAWSAISGSAENAWVKIKTGVSSLIRTVAGVLDTLSTTIKGGFIKLRQGVNAVIEDLSIGVARQIMKMPSAVSALPGMKALQAWAQKNVTAFEKGGGAAGRDRRDRAELSKFDAQKDARDKKRKQEAMDDQLFLMNTIKGNQAESGGKAKAVVAGRRKTLKDGAKAGRDIEVAAKQVWKDRDAAAATSKKLRAEMEAANKEKEDDSSLGVGGKTKKGKAVKKDKPKTPGAAAVGAARGSVSFDPGVRGEIQSLVGSTGMLVNTMNNFVKNPVKVEIKLDAKSSLRRLLTADGGLKAGGAV